MQNAELVFVMDKEVGPTSFDMVRRVRRFFPKAKVGHAGSLDPFATGVLVVLVGRATKLSHALLNADKKYHATAELGRRTDSYDRTGTVSEEKPVPPLTVEGVRETLSSFEGEWFQTPPTFSAKKFQGVRLYDLARQNIYIRKTPEPVTIFATQLTALEGTRVEFDVHCSKGTYIRSFADEFGQRLGTVAHLAELRRTACGPFTLADVTTLDEIEAGSAKAFEAGRANFLRLLRIEGLVPKTPRVRGGLELQTQIKGDTPRLFKRG